MLGVLVILNVANLVMALIIKYGKLLGKADLMYNESDNIDLLLGLTVMIFAEIIFIAFDFLLESYLLMVRLLPTICEYLFVFRLFNRYLLFFHLPKERTRVIAGVGAAITCRVILAYFYLQNTLWLGGIVLLLETIISVAFIYGSSHKMRHFGYIAGSELPVWENDYFEEDIESFKIGLEQRKWIVYSSNTLQAFILNGTLWMTGILFELHVLHEKSKLSFDLFNLTTRVVPHSIMLLCYLVLCLKDKSQLQREKTFIYELKDRLNKPEI
jgi:hypothetical protein